MEAPQINARATPRVSLLMPVYNSFSYERSDGKDLLPVALTSLINQSFTDWELIILDNQSTDDTPKICQAYASKDARIRYVRDTQKRFAEEAIGHLASLAEAPYCLIVNDDDVWAKDYVEKGVTYLDAHPDIDLVYGTALFIDVTNKITGIYAAPSSERYTESLEGITAINRYIHLRNVLPINFGLFRTTVFRAILPYQDFDTLKANVDNLLMLKFFLLKYRVSYQADMHFFYRRKSRLLNPKGFASDMPPLEEPLGIWFFYIRHQLRFYKKFVETLDTLPSSYDTRTRTFIEYSMFVTNLQYAFDGLRWLVGEMKTLGRVREAQTLSRFFNSCTQLRNDLAKYPDVDEAVLELKRGGVEILAVWEARKKQTAQLLLNTIERAKEIESSETSLPIFNEIHETLLPLTSLELTSSMSPTPSPKHTSVTADRIRKFLNYHPTLKQVLFSIRALYLNMRFAHHILYIRSISKNTEAK